MSSKINMTDVETAMSLIKAADRFWNAKMEDKFQEKHREASEIVGSYEKSFIWDCMNINENVTAEQIYCALMCINATVEKEEKNILNYQEDYEEEC